MSGPRPSPPAPSRASASRSRSPPGWRLWPARRDRGPSPCVGRVVPREVGPDRVGGLAEVEDDHRRRRGDTGAALLVEDRGFGDDPWPVLIDDPTLDSVGPPESYRPREPGGGLAGVRELVADRDRRPAHGLVEEREGHATVDEGRRARELRRQLERREHDSGGGGGEERDLQSARVRGFADEAAAVEAEP